jgi:hypothetical protein
LLSSLAGRPLSLPIPFIAGKHLSAFSIASGRSAYHHSDARLGSFPVLYVAGASLQHTTVFSLGSDSLSMKPHQELAEGLAMAPLPLDS